MSRLSLSLLSRLGAGRGSALPASSTLLADGLSPAADGCGSSGGSPGAFSRPGLLAQPRRSLANHQYNLARPVDTKRIDELLASATALEHAMLPVLRYGGHFDPEQVTRTLQRVPRMMRYQQRKGAADPAAARPAAARLLDVLGSRLAEVAGDCSDRQLARALWAFGVTRHTHPAVIRAACEELPRRLPAMSPPHLATAAWGLAAAAGAQGGELRESAEVEACKGQPQIGGQGGAAGAIGRLRRAAG
ncbi:hypothetical protein TSOC_001213 [Tetrabaena socialis]|uniref:Uncharacterized protein n=1 Tax=Tetrabaena socialis TaxID=47790 RepID=A0A2J8AH91_9CHLO|nr:hypothetical protein TSOC_001213 [Tetrabaena socialis]|eukprot:PNH11894.1 hypothetical protein TSOC_001213 [Tetrabaena socialis]